MAVGGWRTQFQGDGTDGSDSGIVTATSPRHGDIIDAVRNDLILLGSLRQYDQMDRGHHAYELFPAVAATFEDHPLYLDVEVDWDKLLGNGSGTISWIVQVLCDVKCENASVTVTPRIVVAGTSTVVVTGSAHASTSRATQTLTIPSSTGVVSYRVQLARSATTNPVFLCVRMLKYAGAPVA